MSTSKGRQGEAQACRYLQQRGYEILQRNRRLGRGELDIVAKHHDLLVFIEVKSHKHRDASLEAMHVDKQQRIISAAQAWLGQHPQYANCQCRFDLLMVIPARFAWLPPRVEHIEDIIRL